MSEEQKADLDKLSKRKHRVNGFEQWGGYMESKKMKLSEQFKGQKDIEILQEGEITDIFNGVSIFVNGYTKPPADELKKLMMLHGGTYHYYYSSTKTTHTVASNLPHSKQRNLGSQVVVSADWILDSIKAGRRLPHQNYLLYTPEVKDKQHRLNFTPIKNEQDSTASSDTICDRNTTSVMDSDLPEPTEMVDRSKTTEMVDHSETTGVVEKLEATKMVDQSEVAEMVDQTEVTEMVDQSEATELADGGESACGSRDSGASGPIFHDDSGDGDLVETHGSCLEKVIGDCGDSSPVNGNLSFPVAPESKVPDMSVGNSSNALADPGASAMKAGHPAFVSEFYNHSRLHHISTAGQELKRYVQSLSENNAERNFPAREKLRDLARTTENVEFGGDSPLENMRVVMHLDMDCFFVSVGLRNHPELRGLPVAVTHSKGKRNGIREGSDPLFEANHYADESRKKLGGVLNLENDGTPSALEPRKLSKYSGEFGSLSEIASCSYEAREAGIRNGMFLGEALRRCPDLKTMPYDFEGYSEVSKQLYDIVASYTLDIEAVSCDELYIECTELLKDTGIAPLHFASILRSEIEQKTRCTASAGLGGNMLLARLGNRRAKPNGQYYVQEEEVEDFMKLQKVRDLPGVGYTTSKKLEQSGVFTCGDLQSRPLSRLQREFGPKTGSALYDRCRGRCGRKVEVQKERKSVSAEINYGIRFEEDEEVNKFINELSVEVQNRLQNINSRGKSVTLKLMIRRPEAPVQTAKFMGHGVCNSISKSVLLKTATSDASIIGKECCSLIRMLKIKPQDYRGIGIQISKLESNLKEEKSYNALESFLCKERNTDAADISNQEIFSPKKLKEVAGPSPLEKNSIKDLFSKKEPPQKPWATFEANITPEQIDQSVLDALPEDIRNEVLRTYRISETSGSSKHPTSKKSANGGTKSKSGALGSKKSNKQLLSTSRMQGTSGIASAFGREAIVVEEPPPPKRKKATLGGVEDIDDIRSLIREWMHSSEGLLEEDVEQFKNYLLEVVTEDLEKLNLILRYFYRLCKAAEERWREVYLKCLAHVQKKMLLSYGSMLEANSQF